MLNEKDRRRKLKLWELSSRFGLMMVMAGLVSVDSEPWAPSRVEEPDQGRTGVVEWVAGYMHDSMLQAVRLMYLHQTEPVWLDNQLPVGEQQQAHGLNGWDEVSRSKDDPIVTMADGDARVFFDRNQQRLLVMSHDLPTGVEMPLSAWMLRMARLERRLKLDMKEREAMLMWREYFMDDYLEKVADGLVPAVDIIVNANVFSSATSRKGAMGGREFLEWCQEANNVYQVASAGRGRIIASLAFEEAGEKAYGAGDTEKMLGLIREFEYDGVVTVVLRGERLVRNPAILWELLEEQRVGFVTVYLGNQTAQPRVEEFLKGLPDWVQRDYILREW